MKVYLYYNKEDRINERGFKEEKGAIYCWSNEKLNDDCVYLEVDESILNDLSNHRIIEGALVFDEELSKCNKLTLLRAKREPLLNAFDKYNMSVTRGIIQESNAQKSTVLEWYRNILDLDEVSINNPPQCITYYIS